MSLLLVFSRHRSRPSRRAGHAAAAQRISACSLLTPGITAKYLDTRIAKYLTPDEEPVGVVGTRCEYGRIGLQVDPVGAGPSPTTFGPDWQPQPGLGQAAFYRPNRTWYAELYQDEKGIWASAQPVGAARKRSRTLMRTTDIGNILALLFSELIDGAPDNNAFVLNGGDAGLLRSLDGLSASDASRSVHDGATIAAHVRHVRYGLSLMNRWASEGGNPFANADWSEAWKTTAVDEATWKQIRSELREEAHQWLPTLKAPRDVVEVELSGMIASVVHLAYHLGAIRQIGKNARGPKEGAGN